MARFVPFFFGALRLGVSKTPHFEGSLRIHLQKPRVLHTTHFENQSSDQKKHKLRLQRIDFEELYVFLGFQCINLPKILCLLACSALLFKHPRFSGFSMYFAAIHALVQKNIRKIQPK